LKYAKLSKDAFSPVKTDLDSVGFDLRSPITQTVLPLSCICINTDLQLIFPEGCYGRIAARSGMALKKNVSINGGVIDPSYRGNVGVIIRNNDPKEVLWISRGDKIAQIICEKYTHVELKQIRKQNINSTLRGATGFGSSGN